MKVKSNLMLLAVVLGIVVSQAKAADEIVSVEQCVSNQAMADAGYLVKVIEGGFLGELRAEISQISFLGKSRIMNDVYVRKVLGSNSTTYLDRQTNGAIFRLDLTKEGNIFRAVVNGTPYPSPSFPEFGNLVCAP